MTRSQIRALLDEAYEARRIEDVDRALAVFSDTAVFRIVANDALGPVGQAARGKAALKAHFEALFTGWNWLEHKLDAMVIDDAVKPVRAAIRSTGRLQHAATGREIPADILDLVTIEDGKITDFVEYLDTDLVSQVLRGAS